MHAKLDCEFITDFVVNDHDLFFEFCSCFIFISGMFEMISLMFVAWLFDMQPVGMLV